MTILQSEIKQFQRNILQQSIRFLGSRNHETGTQYLPENTSYDEIAVFWCFTHQYLLSFKMLSETNININFHESGYLENIEFCM